MVTTKKEAEEFEQNPLFSVSVQIRHYEEEAKYKNRTKIQKSSEDRGPNDLTLMIERLEKENKEIKRKLKNVERMIYEDWKRRFFNK